MTDYNNGPSSGFSYPNAGPTPPEAYGSSSLQGEGQGSTIQPKEPHHKKKSSRGSVKTFFTAFAGAALACVLGLGGFVIYQSNTSSSSGSSGITSITVEGDDITLAEAVAEKCLPSVVAIDVYTAQTSSYGGFFGSSTEELTETSLGSGVVISEDGYILTNYHVIEDADALIVTIDGQEYDAEVVGTDSSSDLAVIKAQGAEDLTVMELGDSDELTVGEWVMSIGSPFGLEQSVATGIVSATNRSQILSTSTDSYGQSETTIYTNMIQTDAAINPGNSGGALVDSEGKLIGINTLITSYSGNYSGVGFAIPVNYAISIAEQIIAGETPSHAQLGVTMTTVDSSIAQRYGFSVDSGAYVSAVAEGSGADEAGIQVGDIITAFNGESVTSASDLTIAVRSMNPGDTVSVEVNREGETLEFEVTLGTDTSSTEE